LAAQAERSAADDPVSRPGRWADFQTPAMACHRIRLELVRMAAAQPLSTDPLCDLPLEEWQQSAEKDLGAIDADRLLAVLLRRRLSTGSLPQDEVKRLAALEEAAAERVRQSRSALCCHRAVPPLFTVLAWCWSAAGRNDRAIALLHVRRREALKAGDADAENAALTATLEISRRIRVAQRVLAKNSSGSADADQRAAAWALAVLTEQPGVLPAECPSDLTGAGLHDWWRTRPAPLSQEDTRPFRDRAGLLTSGQGDQTPFTTLSLGLDLAEAALAESAVPAWVHADPAELAGSGQVTGEQLIRLVLRMQALGHPGYKVSDDDPSAGVSAWWVTGSAPAVGARRRAELAMDEGELLALRLPREAILLLDLAALWFTETDDPASALFAAIAGTLARLRAGIPVPDLDKSLAGLYEALASRVKTPLPDWTDVHFALTPLVAPGGATARLLGGWLLRLAVCAVRAGPEASGTAAWSIKADRAEPMLRASLESIPAELDPAVLTRRPARRRRRPAQKTDPDTRRPRITLGIVAGFVSVIALILASVGYAGGLAGEAAGITAVFGVLVIFVFLGLAVFGLLLAWRGLRQRLSDRLRVWWWARTVLALRIAFPPGSDTRGGDTQVTIQKWQRDPAGPLPWRRHTPSTVTETAVLPPMRAYGPGAEALPAGLRDGLRELAGRVSPGWVRACLDVDPALERIPWEALLSHPVVTGSPPRPGALDFWRRGERLPLTGRPEDPHPPRRAVVLADSSRRLFAERTALARELSFPDLSARRIIDVNLAVERAGSAAVDPPDVALVIGRPVRLEYSVLLQTTEQVVTYGIPADELREAFVDSGLLEAQVVAGLRARLFVVLGAPAESSSRFDTERRDAADLRAWAGDVFRAGTAAVISLPSLHPQLAEAVLRDIAAKIRKGITADTMHAAVRAARQRIATWTQPAPVHGDPPESGPAAADRQLEQALDVCLFRRSRMPAFMTREERA
jgi:hypothetical protein